MNKELLKPEVQDFIRQNIKSDLTRLVLKGSPFSKITSAELAQQIAALATAKKKLPTWFSTNNIIYPPKINLEQSSSEITARYKASLVKGEKLLDLTGGLGVDDYCFAENLEEVIHCEINGNLSEIAKHNFQKLERNNITTHTGDGLEFLKHYPGNFNVIFLDPSRRDSHGGKVFKMADCLPNVPANLQLLFEKSKMVLVKTSPLLDLKAGIEELKFVSEIHIVAVNNDVKELLWILNKETSAENPVIATINFTKSGVQKFQGIFQEKLQANYSVPKRYLYEPNSAVMKSGLFERLSLNTATFKLHANSHLFTSEEKKEFPGRIFEITDILSFKTSILKKRFKGKKAHLSTRNFPESVVKLRKQLQIKDGGETYLFFTTNLQEEKIVLVCEKTV